MRSINKVWIRWLCRVMILYIAFCLIGGYALLAVNNVQYRVVTLELFIATLGLIALAAHIWRNGWRVVGW